MKEKWSALSVVSACTSTGIGESLTHERGSPSGPVTNTRPSSPASECTRAMRETGSAGNSVVGNVSSHSSRELARCSGALCDR
eukprot:1321986-Pleurochrysis_carterae.AAC.2